MKKYSVIAGITGSILLFFGLLNVLITSEWDSLSLILTGLGAVSTLFYLVYNIKDVIRLFSLRSTQHFGNAVISSVLVLGILILLNFLFQRHNTRYDLTEIKQFTLSELTINVLENLKNEVKITAFERTTNRLIFDSIFQEFKHYSDFVTYEFIDPDQNPAIAGNYGVQVYGDVVFESGVRTEKINGNREQILTNALIKVTREEVKKIYFTTGHGEADIEDFGRTGYSKTAEQLRDKNYEVAKLDLAREKSIPADCSVLVVNGPRSIIYGAELDTLDAFVLKGGKILFMLEPMPAPGFEQHFDKWGLTVGNDVIIDNSGAGRLYGMGPEVPMVASYGKHMIVEDFGQQNTFFPTARSVTPRLRGLPQQVEVEPLAVTSQNSWGETEYPIATSTNQGEKGSVQYDEGKDVRGPVCIAAVVTYRLKEGGPENIQDLKKGAMVVVGDSEFACNVFNAHNPNVSLFMNMINWLAQEEDLVAIPSKDPQDRRVAMTDKQVKFVLYLTVFLIPGLIMLSGVGVYVRRKNL